jgi:uncharacterized phage protein (TIGR01671 family)
MREIKFRGKRIDNGEWVYGNYFIDERDIEDGFIWRDIPQIQQRYGDHYQYYDVDPSTVGQYTGLKDKNGKEIYEGDIIRHHDDILSEVFYNTAHCAYLLQDISGNRNKCQCDRLGSYYSLWIEVIDNIHDNPELLGGAE